MNDDHKFGPPHALCPYCFGTGIEVDSTSLGKTLRERRERCGIGMREMARLTGIPSTNLHRLEYGKMLWTLAHRDAVVAQCTAREKALNQ